jgi:hypothetical protein
MNDALAKKLKIKSGDRLIQFEPPANFTSILSVDVAQDFTANSADVLLFFALNSSKLKNHFLNAYHAVKAKGLIWVLFPKKSAGIQSDLTRDTGWESIENVEMKPLTLVSFDEKWSAFGFRKEPGMSLKKWSAEVRGKVPENPYIDKKNRVVHLPEEFKLLLDKEPNTFANFNALSFTNQKEMIEWIANAKREDTKINRLNKSLEKLRESF